MSVTKSTGGPPVARRRQLEGGICHWWSSSSSPPANNVASGPPAISWAFMWWATTGNWWHTVVGQACWIGQPVTSLGAESRSKISNLFWVYTLRVCGQRWSKYDNYMKFILLFIVDNPVISSCYIKLLFGTWLSGWKLQNTREMVAWVGLAGTRLFSLNLAKPKPAQNKIGRDCSPTLSPASQAYHYDAVWDTAYQTSYRVE